MSAEVHNLVIEQGATFDQTFIWQDEDGNAIDLTGYTAKMQVREFLDSTAVLLELSTGSGITLDAAGHIALQATASQTASLNFKTALYDLLLINGDAITRLVQGRIALSKRITQ